MLQYIVRCNSSYFDSSILIGYVELLIFDI